MSDSQNVQVSFTSDTGNLDAGTQAAAQIVETAAAGITDSLEAMGEQAAAASASMSEAISAGAATSGAALSSVAGVAEAASSAIAESLAAAGSAAAEGGAGVAAGAEEMSSSMAAAAASVTESSAKVGESIAATAEEAKAAAVAMAGATAEGAEAAQAAGATEIAVNEKKISSISALRAQAAIAQAEINSYQAAITATAKAAAGASEEMQAATTTALTEQIEKLEAAKIEWQEYQEAIERAEASQSGSMFAGMTLSLTNLTEGVEGLRARMSVFSSAASALSEFVLAGLALDQVKEAVLGVAETGEQMLHLSQATGITTEQLSGLKLATQEAGGDFDSFQSAVTRLANNMENSIRQPTGAAGEAFKALGISVTDANGQLKPTSDILDEVGQKLSGYADGTDKAALEMSLFGMRGQELVPILNQLQGDGGVQGATDKITAMGGALSEAAAEADEKFMGSIHDTTAALEALGSDIIQGIIPGLTSLGSGMTTGGAATDLMGIAVNTLETVLKGVIGTFSLVESIVADVVEAFYMLGQEIGDIISLSSALELALEGHFHAAAQAVEQDASNMATNYENAVHGMEQNTDSFINTLNALQSTAGNVTDVMQNLQAHEGGGDTGPALPQAPVMETSNSDSAAKKAAENAIQVAQDQANEEQQIAEAQYAGQVDIWDAEVAQNKITKAQEITDEITAADQKYATDLDAAQKKVALYQQGTAAYQKALDDEELLEAQHNDAILKLDAQLAQAQEEQAKKVCQCLERTTPHPPQHRILFSTSLKTNRT